jgi:hypothetical protein
MELRTTFQTLYFNLIYRIIKTVQNKDNLDFLYIATQYYTEYLLVLIS